MSKAFLGALLALATFAVAPPAHAGKGGPPAPTVSTSGRNDNALYAGLNWNFGARTGVTAVVGVRAAKVRTDAQVHGFKAEISYVLSGAPMGLGEARVKYLAGSREAQGEVGVGYSFQGVAPLLTLGAQGPFFNGGLDFLWGKGVMGSIGMNTLDRVRDPNRTLSCPTGFSVQGSGCVSSD